MSATAMFGYPDWQRLTNWDGPVIWSLPATAGPPTITSPILQVSRYACLGGIISLTVGKAAITFTWYADQAATIQIAQRQLRLDAGKAANAQLRIPNMGGWCVITISALAGAAFTAAAQIMPTNRAHPLELIPLTTFGLGLDSTAVNNNATFIVANTYLCSGHAHWWVNANVASVIFQLQYLQSDGTYKPFEEILPPAATDVHLDLALPTVSTQLVVTNLNAAVATVITHLIPSMTGA